MRWHRAPTYRRVEVGVDETRNPVTELRATGESVLVRHAPWIAADDETAGNAFGMVSRTFITKARPDLLEDVDAIEVGGRVYEVTGMTRGAATTAIKAERAKDGD